MKKIFFSVMLVFFIFSLVFISCDGSSKLLGAWEEESSGETLELLKNGDGFYDGIGIKWRTEGNQLILTAPDGTTISSEYKVDGKTLYLTTDGYTSRSIKKDSKSIGGSGNTESAVSKGGGGDPRLVGFWEEEDEVMFYLSLMADGKGYFAGEPIQWAADRSTLTIVDEEGDSISFDYEVDDEELYLENDEDLLVFIRSEGQ
jgi:hypothetical protein